MNMQAAISDLILSLQSIPGLSVNTQKEVAGAADFTLSIVHGALETDHHFGAKKIRQELALELTTKGTANQPANVYFMNKQIQDIIEFDRRRGGNAQTTIFSPWETEEDNGREGLTQASIVEIHVYES